jgi:hypothetical protein
MPFPGELKDEADRREQLLLQQQRDAAAAAGTPLTQQQIATDENADLAAEAAQLLIEAQTGQPV